MTDDELEAVVRTALDATGAAYEVLPCDPMLADTAAFCAHYGWSTDVSANTILVSSKSDPPSHVACVVLASTRLDVNNAVRRRLGARKVSFASAETTAALTGMVIGGVTAFGLPGHLPIWVDAAVMQRERLILGGGTRATKILTTPAALAATPNVEVVEGLASPVAT